MPKTVIAVDDSMSIRETVKMVLGSAGYEVLSAEDGMAGLRLCEQRKADLVITDLNMPQMDGITLITRLRALPQYKFTPIIMLTTEAGDGKKAEGQAAGAKAWVVKPFQPAQMLTAVSKLVLP
jgi:two-component system chemotaxis response regulator CheY